MGCPEKTFTLQGTLSDKIGKLGGIILSEYYAVFPRCRKCGNPMNIAEVNTKPENNIGGNYKSVLLNRNV